MLRVRALLLSVVPLVVGCAAHRTPPVALPQAAEPKPVVSGWRAVAKPEDQVRIDALAATWRTAKGGLKGRSARRVTAEGALIDPDRTLPGVLPPNGTYHCRLLRFGGAASFRTFAPDLCYVLVEGANTVFVKQTGENLPSGWLMPDGDRRLVFLGTFRPPGTSVVAPYGKGAGRDIAGVLERVGAKRWRLVMAEAGQGARLDVYELVPFSPGSQPTTPPQRL